MCAFFVPTGVGPGYGVGYAFTRTHAHALATCATRSRAWAVVADLHEPGLARSRAWASCTSSPVLPGRRMQKTDTGRQSGIDLFSSLLYTRNVPELPRTPNIHMSKQLHRQTQSEDCTQLAESLRTATQFENSILRKPSLAENEWFYQVAAEFIQLDDVPADDDGHFTQQGQKELHGVANRLRLLAEMFEQFAKGID